MENLTEINYHNNETLANTNSDSLHSELDKTIQK